MGVVASRKVREPRLSGVEWDRDRRVPRSCPETAGGSENRRYRSVIVAPSEQEVRDDLHERCD